MPTNDLYYVQLGSNWLLKPEYATQYNVGVVYSKRFGKGAVDAQSYGGCLLQRGERQDNRHRPPTSSSGQWLISDMWRYAVWM